MCSTNIISKQIKGISTPPRLKRRMRWRRKERFAYKRYRIKSRTRPPSPIPIEYNPADYDWNTCARANQKPPPGLWTVWLILAGRGFGKTRTGAETIRAFVDSEQTRRVAFIGQTLEEARVVMIEGVSGLLSVYPPDDPNYPQFEPSKHLVRWPNGAVGQVFGADHYDRLRGPQFDCAWMDEFAKFRYPARIYEQVMLGLRLGEHPRCIITTTPRPIPALQSIMQDPATVLTQGTTFDNAANLSPAFLRYIKKRFAHTRLGEQELYAKLLSEEKNALWKRHHIRYRPPGPEEWQRIVIGVDPAVSYQRSSDETGIIVAAQTFRGEGVILADLSGRWRPNEWAARVVQAYHQYHADRVVAEVNQGGDLVAEMLRSFDPSIAYTPVHATRGKYTRAEPIAALYEQGRIWHTKSFSKLEEQMCSYVPGASRKSPDRMDALVWALTDLFRFPAAPAVRVWWADPDVLRIGPDVLSIPAVAKQPPPVHLA